MQFFEWLEGSAFSMWVKDPETLFGYDMYLTSHAIGMALLVGFSAAIALRVLGGAPDLPLRPMARFFPVIITGFWINALSGFVLFVIYPTKPIKNPVFYVKMTCIAAALICLARLRRELFGRRASANEPVVTPKARRLAAGMLLIWLSAITAGRLMAYHGIANVERQVTLAMVILVAVLLAVAYAVVRVRVSTRRARREPVAQGS